MTHDGASHTTGRTTLSTEDAQELLNSVPPRPRRHFSTLDHLSTATMIACSLASGLLALSGHPWLAIIPAAFALIASNLWLSRRLGRPNEPRLQANIAVVVFTVWMIIPLWRGITRGDTAPFPESLILAGLAPAAWLVFYLILLIRR